MNDWRQYETEADAAALIPETYSFPDSDGKTRTVRWKTETGELLLMNFPVRVPVEYVKTAEYCGDLEVFAAMGQPLVVGDDRIPPPSLGVFSLLETMSSPFVNKPAVGLLDFYRVLYVNHYRRAAAPLVFDHYNLAGEPGESEFDKRVLAAAGILKTGRFLRRYRPTWRFFPSPAVIAIVRNWFFLAFNGYAMLPAGAGGSEFWFGAEAMGANLATAAAALNATPDQILWDVPMVLLGHTVAATARNNGAKVARPDDMADLRRQMILALLRELHGELHPWQIAEPLRRQLTPLQMDRGGMALIRRFEAMSANAADALNLHPVKRTA